MNADILIEDIAGVHFKFIMGSVQGDKRCPAEEKR
jgi:hypothetical protein